MEANTNPIDDNNNSILDAEIDFRLFFEKIIRHKNIVAILTILGIIFGFLNAFTSKKVWEGGFEIVISEKNEPLAESLVNRFNLGNITGNSFKNSKLNTEVQILQSPSVLIDTFEFVKSRTNNQKLRFNDWESQFTFELLPNTSILSISYRDTDKVLIQETLNMISNTYQKYSGNKRDREIELGIGFLNDQLPIYKENALNSTKEAQEFAFKYDLMPPIILSGNPSDSINSGDSNLNIESQRIEAINQIKILNSKKVQLEKSDLNNEEIILYATQFIPKSQTLVKLNQINLNLSSLLDTYTEKDISIINLKSLKKKLIKDIKIETYETIIASMKEFDAIVRASERPEGVLGKYSQLVLQASQDQFAYNELEKQYRLILLEKARYKDPWKLITEPTIIPNPVAPNKLLVISISTFIAFILGILISLIKDKTEDFVYSEYELKRLLPYKILVNLNESEESEYREDLDLFLKKVIKSNSKNLILVKLLEVNDSRLERIKKFIKKQNKDLNFLLVNNLREIAEQSNLILLVELGVSKKLSIKKLQNKLSMQGIKLDGILVLSKQMIIDKKSKNNFLKSIFKIS